MPKLMNTADTDVNKTVSNFSFSAKRPEKLTGTQYTIVDFELDNSFSVEPFKAQLEEAAKTVVESLKKSPCVDRVLLRTSLFDSSLRELHGFIPVPDVKESEYAINPGGSTALFDATVSGVEAVGAYGETLENLDYEVNGLVIVASDGGECASRSVRSADAVKRKVQAVKDKEHLESLKLILIGIGNPDEEITPGKTFRQHLEEYRDQAGFDQLVMIGEATPDNLAKMGGFISRSISSSSQALSTGGPSKNLSF